MSPKTTRILYWTVTILFVAAMLPDGVAGVLHEQTGQEVMRHLGYPIYAMTIFGVAKILGALAIAQTRYRTVKEWAYAGFTINFLGAAASRGLVGDGLGLMVPPFVLLAVMFASYFLWKKVRRQAATSPTQQPDQTAALRPVFNS